MILVGIRTHEIVSVYVVRNTCFNKAIFTQTETCMYTGLYLDTRGQWLHCMQSAWTISILQFFPFPTGKLYMHKEYLITILNLLLFLSRAPEYEETLCRHWQGDSLTPPPSWKCLRFHKNMSKWHYSVGYCRFPPPAPFHKIRAKIAFARGI